MTNRSDRGSAKPRGSQRFERDDVIREPACGLHQGQQPCGAAQTGRTHGCTRPVLIIKQKLLRRRGRPHMDLQRRHHCTATLVQGPSTPSRQLQSMAGEHGASCRVRTEQAVKPTCHWALYPSMHPLGHKKRDPCNRDCGQCRLRHSDRWHVRG